MYALRDLNRETENIKEIENSIDGWREGGDNKYMYKKTFTERKREIEIALCGKEEIERCRNEVIALCGKEELVR
jgi:hypothetical protein